MNFNSLSRGLYKAARLSRDINALSRGPKATAHRVVRKGAYRAAAGPFARLLNRILGR